jgi:hypothetical protein
LIFSQSNGDNDQPSQSRHPDAPLSHKAVSSGLSVVDCQSVSYDICCRFFDFFFADHPTTLQPTLDLRLQRTFWVMIQVCISHLLAVEHSEYCLSDWSLSSYLSVIDGHLFIYLAGIGELG